MLLSTLLLLQTALPSDSLADARLRHRNGRVPRSVTATRVEAPPRIDGRLDDQAWFAAKPESGFRRDVPSDGNPAAEETEVRVLYDDHALYVGARLFDKRPDLVSRRLSRRDSFDNFNDGFFVLIDSYHDHQTQFIFGVTPAGEKRDASMGGDGDGSTIDVSWDPVWDVSTSIDSLGWVAEARIPFSQLRFPDRVEQIWGIQFRRDLVRAGEAVDWQWSPQTEPGKVSKFGHLVGLRDIPAPRRLEFLPYVKSQGRLTEGADPASPFDDGSVLGLSGGLDLKYGLTSSLTLNATVNPDFGQVEADPAVVNLTAFETFFEERRPLFVEGSSIFAFGNRFDQQQFFYSRRIGRAPSLSALGSAPYVDQPAATSILGAVKLSGKTRSGWSIGALDAVTGRESARLAVDPNGPVTRVPLEPLTNYAVLRVQRDLAGGSSGYGAIATGVHRDVDPVAFPTLRRAAYAGAIDFFHRWSQNSYALRGWIGGSSIHGDPAAIQEAQLSSARYFQRPDQDHVRFDPNARSLGGYGAEANLAKESGDWVFELNGHVASPGFELNDAGFQTEADRIRLGGGFGRRWLVPGKLARLARTTIRFRETLNFGGIRAGEYVELDGGIETHNFMEIYGVVGRRVRGLDDRATRGGPLLERPGNWFVHGGVSTDRRRLVSTSLFGTLNRDARGGDHESIFASLTLQTGGNFFASVTPQYDHSRAPAFYVGEYADPTATATFGRRFVFAGLEQHTLSVSARINWYFTPTLSLQVYAQPFLATGDFDRFRSVSRPRSFAFSDYGDNGSTVVFDPGTERFTLDSDGPGPAPSFAFPTPDFRMRSLRSNVVLRWEYLPGSTLFLVWNQNRFGAVSDPRFRAVKDLLRIFDEDMQNVFLVKLNYYFSI